MRYQPAHEIDLGIPNGPDATADSLTIARRSQVELAAEAVGHAGFARS